MNYIEISKLIELQFVSYLKVGQWFVFPERKIPCIKMVGTGSTKYFDLTTSKVVEGGEYCKGYTLAGETTYKKT